MGSGEVDGEVESARAVAYWSTLKNCLLALRSLLEESGEARVEGLRDKGSRLGRIEKF
ncbi:hypothetical protein N186_03990 [Thermofilum adornatum]|uniref:Uncharacterized protein n=1 Tax=Thermofilum adornatum TaxID=1365176 RepID=S6A5I9_9CREN|nr:hypothetical protein [Thermofilum adornatum]AGT35157.1 hypothetical protein N186_03990 [Thermofilum adornatum]